MKRTLSLLVALLMALAMLPAALYCFVTALLPSCNEYEGILTQLAGMLNA